MQDIPFADYLRGFDYDERIAMKIQLPELLKLFTEDKVQLIDIRSPGTALRCPSRANLCRNLC
jgi:hypothetical protein